MMASTGDDHHKETPKYANTGNQELQKLITLIRSLGMWKCLEHKKCQIPAENIRDNLCSYCSTRSYIVKLARPGGMRKLKPTEIETIIPVECNKL